MTLLDFHLLIEIFFSQKMVTNHFERGVYCIDTIKFIKRAKNILRISKKVLPLPSDFENIIADVAQLARAADL